MPAERLLTEYEARFPGKRSGENFDFLHPHGFADELTDRPPVVHSYSRLEPARQFVSAKTRRLEPGDTTD